MKKILFILVAIATINCEVIAQNNWPMAPASPTQTVTQLFGTSKIEISYSRPGVKGRTVFGDVVPFDKVWRTGANAASTIRFGEEVTISGTKLAAGRYGLLTIPGKESWTIILSKDTTVNNPNQYKQENDALRISVKPVILSYVTENFTIDINNIRPSEAEIFLRWDKTQVSFKVSIDLDAKASKYITDVMAADNKPYFQSAAYYYENGKDLNQALAWVNKAIEKNPDAFYMIHLKAKIQLKAGDKTGALATAQQSLEKSKAANNEDYIKNNEKLIAEISKK